jgi:hypothetical protein
MDIEITLQRPNLTIYYDGKRDLFDVVDTFRDEVFALVDSEEVFTLQSSVNIWGLEALDCAVLVLDFTLVSCELDYLFLVNHLLDFGLESIYLFDAPLDFAVHDVSQLSYLQLLI